MWIFVDVSRSIFFSGGEDATLLAVQKLGQLWWGRNTLGSCFFLVQFTSVLWPQPSDVNPWLLSSVTEQVSGVRSESDSCCCHRNHQCFPIHISHQNKYKQYNEHSKHLSSYLDGKQDGENISRQFPQKTGGGAGGGGRGLHTCRQLSRRWGNF